MKNVKKNVLLWSAAIILVAVALLVMSKSKASGLPPLNQTPSVTQEQQGALIDTGAREKAPGFTLTDLDGKKVSLSDLKGKNVYINFWATWCPWCKQELPDIDQLANDYKDKNLVVLTIDIGEDNGAVNNFIQSNGYSFNVLLDTDNSVANLYSVSSIPVSVFIDKNGNVAQKRVGAMTYDQMKSIIDKMLSA